MLQFECACGKRYQGKRGYWRLQEHVAKSIKPGCAPRNTSYFSGKVLSSGKPK